MANVGDDLTLGTVGTKKVSGGTCSVFVNPYYKKGQIESSDWETILACKTDKEHAEDRQLLCKGFLSGYILWGDFLEDIEENMSYSDIGSEKWKKLHILRFEYKFRTKSDSFAREVANLLYEPKAEQCPVDPRLEELTKAYNEFSEDIAKNPNVQQPEEYTKEWFDQVCACSKKDDDGVPVGTIHVVMPTFEVTEENQKIILDAIRKSKKENSSVIGTTSQVTYTEHNIKEYRAKNVEVIQKQTELEQVDQGAHYRYKVAAVLRPDDIAKGYIEIEIDPFRICEEYGASFQAGTIVKKALCAGKRGHNDSLEDIEDIICAAERWKAMLLADAAVAEKMKQEYLGENPDCL